MRKGWRSLGLWHGLNSNYRIQAILSSSTVITVAQKSEGCDRMPPYAQVAIMDSTVHLRKIKREQQMRFVENDPQSHSGLARRFPSQIIHCSWLQFPATTTCVRVAKSAEDSSATIFLDMSRRNMILSASTRTFVG